MVSMRYCSDQRSRLRITYPAIVIVYMFHLKVKNNSHQIYPLLGQVGICGKSEQIQQGMVETEGFRCGRRLILIKRCIPQPHNTCTSTHHNTPLISTVRYRSRYRVNFPSDCPFKFEIIWRSELSASSLINRDRDATCQYVSVARTRPPCTIQHTRIPPFVPLPITFFSSSNHRQFNERARETRLQKEKGCK
jgi:hypothetical protein